MAAAKPFEVDWSATQIGEVLEKVRHYPWPPVPDVADGWAYGTDGDFLKDICAYWLDGYDWRAAVADLNRFPQFTARIEDFDIHFVHVVGEAGGKRPLILSHGWPGSHYEFWGSIERLAFPSRFGGEAKDAFDDTPYETLSGVPGTEKLPELTTNVPARNHAAAVSGAAAD